MAWEEEFKSNLLEVLYRADQPRHPAGTPEGGRFAPEGGSGGGGTNVDTGPDTIKGLPENTSLDHPSFDQLRQALDRGQWDFEVTEVRRGNTITTYEVAVLPKNIPSDWIQDQRGGFHDPEFFESELNEFGRAPLKPGVSWELPEERAEGKIYRGMSREEYDAAMTSGQIQSLGAYNLEGQEGLSYYSRSASQATSYASGYAPWQYQATIDKPAMLVRVDDPGTEVRISGTATDEVGIPGPISTKSIDKVWVGNPVSVSKGELEIRVDNYSGGAQMGSYALAMTNIHWSEVEVD